MKFTQILKDAPLVLWGSDSIYTTRTKGLEAEDRTAAGQHILNGPICSRHTAKPTNPASQSESLVRSHSLKQNTHSATQNTGQELLQAVTFCYLIMTELHNATYISPLFLRDAVFSSFAMSSGT